MVSVPSLFIMGMHDALSTGYFRDMTVKYAFTANGVGHKNWMESAIKACDNAPDIAIIFNNIRGD